MSSAHIGFIPKKRQLLIKNENKDVLLYDFVLGSWSKGKSKITVNGSTPAMTNFAINDSSELFYITNTDSDIATWSDSKGTTTNFEYTTKDIDFEEPGVRKKIYKVYVTYSSETASNVEVKYAVDGNTTFNKVFKDGTNFTSNKLIATSNTNWNQAILVPNSSSESNNIYSFALKFLANGTVPNDFRINDITIIYRIKGVR